MNVDIARLKALARAATPGPWYESSEAVWQGPRDKNSDMHIICDTGDAPVETLHYIAAAHPQTVLALIEALEETLAFSRTVRTLAKQLPQSTVASAVQYFDQALAAVREEQSA